METNELTLVKKPTYVSFGEVKVGDTFSIQLANLGTAKVLYGKTGTAVFRKTDNVHAICTEQRFLGNCRIISIVYKLKKEHQVNIN